MKRTKIVATIGPACDSQAVLTKMIKAGVNVARFNFSHGTYASNKKAVSSLRAVAKSLNQSVGIIQDLQGPRIRVGEIAKDGLDLKKGEIVVLVEDDLKKKIKSDKKIVPIQFIKPSQILKAKNKVLLLDGLIELRVTKVNANHVEAKVFKGGIIYTYKGVNIPEIDLGLPVITDKDIKDLEFGLKLGVDYVALSFVGSAGDLKDLKKLIKKFDKNSEVQVLAKIERGQAVKNIKSIIKEADAIMVARGDLGIELPEVKVPIIQKEMIKMCLEQGKPVIVATQMLDSMIRNPKPTRAEVSDVANAVIDHADSVMLSGETAFGKYPVESVKMMNQIILETEKSIYDDMPPGYFLEKKLSVTKAISESVFELVKDTKARAIVAATNSGYTARMIARYRPETRIIVLVNKQEIAHQLSLVWGIYPEMMPVCKSLDELVEKSVALVKKQKLVIKGHQIIIVTGQPVGLSKNMNLVKIHTV
ncbi:MAG: pyruvate kinase [Candidatus Komeilibacteria bacterium CG10_big_fil_rev_8_21_14_0_10_41_13]|uniref:Pyruvate kinase n=1 Tax=Candidatus Komeilibacteria bacterium CG10_big_fil_rev_8_21_14_0_10_41_13 TaxID=1974476 RepID=A0A2M6WC10_9BACT|nr:MAG: pyruvate kinase [Candidatus Komeilibacteria bacterium CG10_big_fil_rev_8_21_14_0_10_41_13]